MSFDKFVPSKFQHRKIFRGRNVGIEQPENLNLKFFRYGIVCRSHGKLFMRQMEAIRVSCVKMLSRFDNTKHMKMRVFAHRPYTKKPLEVRLGKGKGDVVAYEMNLRPGQILVEFATVENDSMAKSLARVVSSKIGFRTALIKHCNNSEELQI